MRHSIREADHASAVRSRPRPWTVPREDANDPDSSNPAAGIASRSPLVVGLALALAIPIVPVLPPPPPTPPPPPRWRRLRSAPAGGAQRDTQTSWRGVGGQVRQAIIPRIAYPRGATGPVRDVALGPDGRWMTTVLGNGAVALWDLDSGQEMARLDDGPPAARGGGRPWRGMGRAGRFARQPAHRRPVGRRRRTGAGGAASGAVNALALSADARAAAGRTRQAAWSRGYDAETAGSSACAWSAMPESVAVAALGARGAVRDRLMADGRLGRVLRILPANYRIPRVTLPH